MLIKMQSVILEANACNEGDALVMAPPDCELERVRASDAFVFDALADYRDDIAELLLHEIGPQRVAGLSVQAAPHPLSDPKDPVSCALSIGILLEHVERGSTSEFREIERLVKEQGDFSLSCASLLRLEKGDCYQYLFVPSLTSAY